MGIYTIILKGSLGYNGGQEDLKLIEFEQKYWNYYLTLENDFMETQRYVSIDEDNYITFSVEYAKQYQTICSEIDVICKDYCKFLEPDIKAENIMGYASVLLNHKPDLITRIVKIKTVATVVLNPWCDWKTDNVSPFDRGSEENNSPVWWTYYNKVKHNRTGLDSDNKEFFKYANQINTLNSLAGLFILVMYYYKDIALSESQDNVTIPNPPSRLFELKDWEKQFILFNEILAMNIEKNSLIYND